MRDFSHKGTKARSFTIPTDCICTSRLSKATSLIIFLPMLIDGEKLKHWIDNFYGYGSWKARIWFVSFEESGGELPEEVADKINYFFEVHPPATKANLCDIRAMYRKVRVTLEGQRAALYTNRYEYRFDKNAVLHGVWKNLIAFAHGYLGEKQPELLSYQKHEFAEPSRNRESLINLFPLPSPHNHAWYYSWLDIPGLSFIRKRTTYQENLYPRRIDTILTNIAEFRPEVVLMYGMSNINDLKTSVQKFFPGTKFKMVKAITQQIPQHHHADLNGTLMIITTQVPALRHNRIETGFDWEVFGKTLAGSDDSRSGINLVL